MSLLDKGENIGEQGLRSSAVKEVLEFITERIVEN